MPNNICASPTSAHGRRSISWRASISRRRGGSSISAAVPATARACCAIGGPKRRSPGSTAPPICWRRRGAIIPAIEFVVGDIASWAPAQPYDLVFSNAALQWVGNHERLLPQLIEAVAADGILAVQMPRNHDFATHRLMRQVAAEAPWRDKLAGARDPSPVKPPEFYYDCLAPKCRSLALWETNYIQVMDGAGAIIAWLHGTGLRPFLADLEAPEQELFLDRSAALLAEAFPVQSDGRILLPYPRLFFIATPK